MSNKERFYCHVKKEYPESEVTSLINADNNCLFYEVCQSYVDVALNAPKEKMENGKLKGYFQYEDINYAQNMTIRFIKDNHIVDYDKFFSMLETLYHVSCDQKDKRKKVVYIENDNPNSKEKGTMYCLTKISDNVFKEMIDYIRTEI